MTASEREKKREMNANAVKELNTIMATPVEEISGDEALQSKGFKLSRNLIGKGAFSQVFKAERVNNASDAPPKYACRVLKLKNMDKKFHSKYVGRYASGILYLKDKCPNINGAYAVFKSKENLYVFTTYCDNGSLFEYMKDTEEKPVPFKLLKRWMIDLGNAIKFIHAMVIAHRNITPRNILLSNDWRVKLTGFFYARNFINPTNGKRRLTRSKRNPSAFIAPEVYRGTWYNAKKVDIFSFGAIFYLLLTGNRTIYDPSNIDETHFGPKLDVINDARGGGVEVYDIIRKATNHYPGTRPNIKKLLNSKWFT